MDVPPRKIGLTPFFPNPLANRTFFQLIIHYINVFPHYVLQGNLHMVTYELRKG